MAFKLELKKIHVDTRMSEETNCFSAELHVNGRKIGEVSNHGTGGPNNVYLTDKSFTEQQLNELCKVHYADYGFDSEYGDKGHVDADLELVCGGMIDRHLTLKSHRRMMKTKVLVLGEKKGEVRSFSWKGVKAITQNHIDAILKSHPEFAGKVLNLMSDEQIWELVK